MVDHMDYLKKITIQMASYEENFKRFLTRVLLIPWIYLIFENIVDPDQLASKEAIL